MMDEYIQNLENRLAALKSDPQPSSIDLIDTLNDLAWELEWLDPDQALRLSQEAHDLAQTTNYYRGLICSLRNISSLNSTVFGQLELAYSQVEEARQLN
jgi:hypothetical protein